jgi:hypothetical protein
MVMGHAITPIHEASSATRMTLRHEQTRWPVSSTEPAWTREPARYWKGPSSAPSCDSPRNAAAVAGGAWFGPIRWSVLRRAYAVVRD